MGLSLGSSAKIQPLGRALLLSWCSEPGWEAKPKEPSAAQGQELKGKITVMLCWAGKGRAGAGRSRDGAEQIWFYK